MKNDRLQKMVAVALFSTMAVIIEFFSFPILPVVPFMQIDFSDIAVILSMFLYGPFAGIVTAVFRGFLHMMITGGWAIPNMVSEVAYLLATSSFALPLYYFFFKKKSSTVNRLVGILSGIITMTVIMSIANYFVITPIYLWAMSTGNHSMTAQNLFNMSLNKYIAVGVVPFNLIKSSILSFVLLVMYSKLLPWIEKKQAQTKLATTVEK